VRRSWQLAAVPGASALFVSRHALRGALVALCVVAQLSTVAHLVFVRHSFCSAHGEAVDGPRTAHRAMGHTSTTRGAFVSDSHEEPGSGEHAHCALAVDRSSRLAAPPPPSVTVPPAPLAERSLEPQQLARIPGAGVLFLAPKTSPPA
jgi:hypothetical protein